MTAVRTLKVSEDAVLSLRVQDGLLFCGLQGSDITVWDLETFQMIRTLKGHQDDVLAFTVSEGYICSGSADGEVRIWNKNLVCCNTFTNSQARGMLASRYALSFLFEKKK